MTQLLERGSRVTSTKTVEGDSHNFSWTIFLKMTEETSFTHLQPPLLGYTNTGNRDEIETIMVIKSIRSSFFPTTPKLSISFNDLGVNFFFKPGFGPHTYFLPL